MPKNKNIVGASEWKSRSDVDGDKKADSNLAAIKVDPIDGYTVSATKNGQSINITDNEISSSVLSALVDGEPASNIVIEVKYDKDGSTKPGSDDKDHKGDNPGKTDPTNPSTGADHKGDKPGQDNTVKVTVQFLDQDEDDKIVTDTDQVMTGKAGDKIDWKLNSDGKLELNVPKHYVLGDNKNNPDFNNFPDRFSDADQTYKVYVKHAKELVSVATHEGDSNYYRRITRAITQNVPGQKPTTITDSIIFTRNGVKDEVTGDVTYGKWTLATTDKEGQPLDSFKQMDFATKGYKVTITNGQGKQLDSTIILAEKVTVDSKDESYTVDYTPETKPGETTIDPSEIGQPATIIIQYKDADEDNKDLSTQTFTGKVGVKIDWPMGDGYIHLNILEHYTLAPNNKNTYPSKFGKTSQTIPVYLKHEITPGYDHKDNPDVYREVKETVVVTEPTDSGTATMTTGTAIVLYRDIDEVTNRPVGNWQNLTDFNGDKKGDTNFEAIKVDPIEGYTASVTKNGQPISITDNEISSSELSALVNGEPAANITIEVKYDKEGSTNPGTGDDQKGDNPGKGEDTPSTDDQDLTIVYGISDQNNHDLYRDIIRTINQHMPDGEVNKMRQGIVLYRNAYKNKAGKIVKYDQWQSTSRTNTLAAMTIPGAGDAYKITYTEDGKQIDGIKEVKVTPDTKSSVIDVNYVPVEQKFVLNYVDKNDPKHVVGHQYILGKIGETVVIDKMNIPKGWTEVPGQPDYNNYHYKFGSKLPEPKKILVEHKIDEISGLQDKNNPELYREVTRTVNITYPDGQTGTGKQQIVFYRIKQEN
ncbi:hypothetical protein E0700_00730 [Lactobacillus helveticus]|nr:hypothetical protein [Lactobacillus helveticus]MBW8036879.1 hypothetical protein [Lactobacillus helveticus]